MKSFTFLITTSIIGIITFNVYFINNNISSFQKPIEKNIETISFIDAVNQPVIQGVNQNISETILGAKGKFDNFYIRVQSDDYLKILNVKCNQKTVRAAFDGETTENISLVGLYFPVDHKKSVILNLKKLLNTELLEKGEYVIEILTSNQNDINGNPIVENKKIRIKVV